jgi:hypothetical protein
MFMSKAASAKAPAPSLASTVFALGRHYLGGRRGLIVLSIAALGAAAFFSWGWLAAIGVAPLLLALAPCAAMCALGLCMRNMGGKSCSTDSKPGDAPTKDKEGRT